ncbi:DUF2169 domain-containing protein [Marinibaculum pumilum]|uniref:DUF2169 domain-containing protein n=1 Tax=Marinibaculum pumilum TaxID=1766165 RepID=A0ABV7KX92_9PROT
MKVYKPLRLGYLSRVVMHAGQARLAVALLSYFPFDAPRRIGLEQDMWQEIMPVLGQQVLDPCDPKPRAEVLVHGAFHAAGGQAVPSGHVRLQLGEAIDKRLRVSGHREWLRSPVGRVHASAPVPLASLPLDWRHAFGGHDCSDNPDGIGHWGRANADGRRPLPCLEYPDEPMALPDDHIRPAAMAPRPLTLPARQKLAGTYDARWFRHHHPGYPADIDPDFFLAAPPDQVLPGYFAGREAFRLEGMHPDRPVQSGHLPGLRARCFVERKPAGTAAPGFDEVPLHADTLFLFPEIGRGILAHHGSVAVEGLDALDIGYLIAGFEWQEDAPRPPTHWHQALERRRDPAGGAMALLATDDICPLGWDEPTLEAARTIRPLVPRENQGVPPRLVRLFDKGRAKAAATMAAAGLAPLKEEPPAGPPKEPPELKEIMAACEALKGLTLNSQADADAFNAQMQAIAEKVERLARGETFETLRAARQVAGRFGYDFDDLLARSQAEAETDPDDVAARIMRTLHQGDGMLPPDRAGELAAALPPDLQGEMAGHLREAAGGIAAMKRDGAHLLPPPARLPASRQAAKARVLAAALSSGQPPADPAMAGLDLSGRRLDGMNLAGVDFTGSDFTGASLIGTNLEGAGLAHADLSRANLSGASLKGANLDKARMDATLFNGADLSGLILTGVAGERLSFDGGTLTDTRFVDARMPGASFAGASLSGTMFDRCEMPTADFRKAKLAGATFAACRLPGAHFDGAAGKGLLMLNCIAPGARFNGCSIVQFAVGGTTNLDGASFLGCTMPSCNLSMASLRGAMIADSLLTGGNFMQSDLTGADLSGSHLRNAVMMRANLTDARLEGTDAMRANLLHARFDGAKLQGANLYGANLMKAAFRKTDLGTANLAKTQLDRSNAP